MCIMSQFWLILILLTVTLHKFESLMIQMITYYYFNAYLSGISTVRVKNVKNLSLLYRPCFVNTSLSHHFKSQPYTTLKRTFSVYLKHKIPNHLEEKISRRLDTLSSSPVGVLVNFVQDFFNSYDDPIISKRKFKYIPIESKPVSITENFDELQVPLDHVSRDPSDTYFLDEQYLKNFKEFRDNKYKDVINSCNNGFYTRKLIDFMGENYCHSTFKLLPTHTTSHLTKLLRQGVTYALYSGQVFRRDEIDSQHYPLFHQLDGYLLFTNEDVDDLKKSKEYCNLETEGVILFHLKKTLENLVEYLYGLVKFVPNELMDSNRGQGDKSKIEFEKLEKKWDDLATFPFTSPSSEYYVMNEGQLTEILGCGVLKNIILENNFEDFGTKYVGGWAFGIGLERLAMVLCKIFDIRQFWETDERFLRQYQKCYLNRVLPIFNKYSKNPSVVRDISFYLPKSLESSNSLNTLETFDERAFKKIFRESGRGYVEDVQFVSSYFNEKLNLNSLFYRIVYRGFDENLTNTFVNELHEDAVKQLEKELNVTVR